MQSMDEPSFLVVEAIHNRPIPDPRSHTSSVVCTDEGTEREETIYLNALESLLWVLLPIVRTIRRQYDGWWRGDNQSILMIIPSIDSLYRLYVIVPLVNTIALLLLQMKQRRDRRRIQHMPEITSTIIFSVFSWVPVFFLLQERVFRWTSAPS